MKLIGKILIVLFALVSLAVYLLPAAVIHVLKYHVFPAEKLTPLVVEWVNNHIDGTFTCDRIDFTLLETFPRLGIRLDNGMLTVEREEAAADSLPVMVTDTLASFSRAMVAFNVQAYLDREVIEIERIMLDRPTVFAYVDENGKANWEIWREDGEKHEDAVDTLSSPPRIDIRYVRIRDAQVFYQDLQSGDYFEADHFRFSFKHIRKETGRRFEIKTETPSLVFETDAYSFLKPTAVRVAADIELVRETRSMVIEKAEATVAGIPFFVNGEICRDTVSGGRTIDMDFGLTVSDLNAVVDYIPKEYFRNRKKTEVGGALDVSGKLAGVYAENIYPDLDFKISVSDGVMKNRSTGKGIQRLDIDAEGVVYANAPSLSSVKLHRLALEGPNTDLRLRGSVKNFDSPYIDAELKGKADLTGMTEEIFNPDSLTIRGSLVTDLHAAFSLNDLMDGRTDLIEMYGSCRIPELRMRNPAAGINVFLRRGNVEIDSARLDSRFLEGGDLIKAAASADSVFIRVANQLYTTIGGLDIQAKTSRILDTTAIMPVTGMIKIGSLRSRTPDSLWVTARNVNVQGGIKSSTTDKKMPVIATRLTMDTLRYLDVPMKTFTVLNAGEFSVEALPMKELMSLRARQNGPESRADSTRRRATTPRRRTGEQSAGTNTAEPDASRRFLRNWEIRGSVKFAQARAFTAMFPLRIRMENTTVRFDTDKVTLTDARVYAGKSDFRLDGELNSLRRAYMGNGKIRGNLSVKGNYLDLNEIMATMERGLDFLDESLPEENLLAEGEGIDHLETIVMEAEPAAEGEAEGIFVVPDNLDLNLTLGIAKTTFRELTLEQVEGEMVVRNQTVNLNKLSMKSEVGSGNMTMVYTAKDKTGASAGLDIEIEQMIVEKFIDMFPSIDTLLPMLRSFEGVLDCQISATCDIDSTLNLVLPSIHSACYLKGENMVLLDGETFAEISKTLMFKNKEKNLIENISVDLYVRDGKIEIYPFLVEVDRYRLAVGGTHGLDMNFDYHISVLKSPVPFKLGIDITGDLDDFKFKVVKCKYKDIFQPARQEELAETRINLRTEIRESIRRSIRTNAPEMERDLRFWDMAQHPDASGCMYDEDGEAAGEDSDSDQPVEPASGEEVA